MNAELKGEVDVTTTIGTRNGVPVIVQTKTVSITETIDGVRRSELHVVETERPLMPLLRAAAEQRQAESNRALEYALTGVRRGARPGDRPGDRRDTVTPEYPNAFNLPRSVLHNSLMP